jgi:hypothetical protein
MPEPKSKKHQANWVSEYFKAHDGKLKELEGAGIVRSISLTTDPKYPDKTTPYMKMKGHIGLAGGLRMNVSKLLKVVRLPLLDRYKIYTVTYSYSLIKRGDQTIFRYCSKHDDREDSPKHHKFHHKHQFDENGAETVTILSEDEWPTLGEALDEAAKFIDWTQE